MTSPVRPPARSVRPPARAAVPEREKKKAVSFLGTITKAVDDAANDGDRAARLTGGDSSSSSNDYAIQITTASCFFSEQKEKTYLKIEGKVAYSVDGYTGRVVPKIGSLPDDYAHAVRAGTTVGVLFLDFAADKQYGYGKKDLVKIFSAISETPPTVGQVVCMVLQYVEFSEDANDTRKLFEGSFLEYYEANPEEADSLGLDPESPPEYVGDEVAVDWWKAQLITVKSYLAARGKKSDKAGELRVTTTYAKLDDETFPDFDSAAYSAAQYLGDDYGDGDDGDGE